MRKNVAEFFIAFEKIANKLNWPEAIWTTLIQSRLIAKAQKVAVSLKDDLSSDFISVKEIILKAYKLVPEAYRQKFRELKKFSNQTYVEFARMKEQLFADWLQSKNVSTFDGLQELVLVEEFKSCVSRDMKLHLEELKLGSLHENAIAADEYTLLHRMYENTYGKWRSPGKQGNPKKENDSGNKGASSRNNSPKKGKGSALPKGSPKRINAPSERYKQLTCSC